MVQSTATVDRHGAQYETCIRGYSGKPKQVLSLEAIHEQRMQHFFSIRRSGRVAGGTHDDGKLRLTGAATGQAVISGGH
ncbi:MULTISPECIES: hypothetical protein [unclassified Achromobacter]|uniref:hypothetical protein n=1 Tax=unclassified Achromobacter TaxID=2626865 RepID=UPI0011778F17|nr:MULTISPECIES: hypothetical protein [unclassified Achromobacter]